MWKFTKMISNSFQVSVGRCLRHILNVKCLGKVSNEELQQRTKQMVTEQHANPLAL